MIGGKMGIEYRMEQNRLNILIVQGDGIEQQTRMNRIISARNQMEGKKLYKYSSVWNGCSRNKWKTKEQKRVMVQQWKWKNRFYQGCETVLLLKLF